MLFVKTYKIVYSPSKKFIIESILRKYFLLYIVDTSCR